MLSAPSIDRVLADLDTVIVTAQQRGSADGYFAALYRRVTAEVQRRIGAQSFADAVAMERFVVAFAGRYLDAWRAREAGKPTTSVWQVALGCDRAYWPIVLQHLLLGMNAHINLDLGVIAAELAPRGALHAVEDDFNRINDVLCEMIDDVQDRLAKMWPAMRSLDRICGDLDESVANFSIRRARSHAWSVATALADLSEESARAAYVRGVDLDMAALGRRILHPGMAVSLKFAWVRLRERGSTREKIDLLLR